MVNPTLAFRLRYPNGHWVSIFDNGAVEGVPPDTVIINRLPYLPHFQRGTVEVFEAAQDNQLVNMSPTNAPQREPLTEKNSSDNGSRVDQSHQA